MSDPRSPDSRSSPAGEADRVEQALDLLSAELRERIRHHPWGHLVNASGDRVSVPLELLASARAGGSSPATSANGLGEAASGALDEAIEALLTHRAVFRPGAVYCLRCDSGVCGHGSPSEARQVFSGYGPTGLPVFRDLGQLLLELKDPRVDLLYSESTRLITRVFSGGDLSRELLDPYRDLRRTGSSGFRLHGQVVAGWYTVDGLPRRSATFALTLQILSTRPRKGKRRLGLNVLAVGPGDETLSELQEKLGELPWAATVVWGQEVLNRIERSFARPRGKPGRGRPSRGPLPEKRLEGLLNGLARRLEKTRRSEDRRTRHAHQRHREGHRPTPMALPDLARARDEDILFDAREETFVVLGDRGRAHIFNPDGKLVTSVRYSQPSIARRREKGRWQPASSERIGELRERIERLKAARRDGD